VTRLLCIVGPNTGLNVQGWVADDPTQHEAEAYEVVLLAALGQFKNPEDIRGRRGLAGGKILKIDYSAAAEVYYMPMRRRGGKRQRLGYRRFPTAAEAIGFVVEDFPAAHTLSPWMLVGENRFDSDAIRRLYDSSDYPLRRRSKRQPKRSRPV